MHLSWPYRQHSDHTFERQPFLTTTPSWSPLVNIMESKFRARANTLERTEHIRPPPRKRRPSTGEYEPSVSGLANMRLRSGSVPPALEPSKMEIGGEAEQPSRPRRMRRLTTRLALDCPATANSSQPSSGHNTPCSSKGSTSALDLCQLTPFGTLENSKANGSKGQRRNSVNHKKGHGHKWNWIWNRGSSGKDSPDHHQSEVIKKHSFLTKRHNRKDRHISCPDITIVSNSNDSSRSTSPVSFKVSLTSLFGSYNSSGSTRPHSASQMTSTTTPNSTLVRRHPKGRASVTVSSLPSQQVVTAATEIVDELRPVQFCQVSDPYECFYIELCNAQICTEASQRYWVFMFASPKSWVLLHL